MIWKKRPDRFERSLSWHLWFAWYPVVMEHADNSEEWVWLQWLACRRTSNPRWCPKALSIIGYVWEYMIPTRTQHGTIRLPNN